MERSMNTTPPELPHAQATLASISHKLDDITTQLAQIAKRQSALDEFVGELSPLTRLAMDGVVERLDGLERAGYFAFAHELGRVVDRVVRSYGPEDVRRLGDQIVGILDTVRNFTQSDTLTMLNEVAGAMHEADEADPKGMWGLVRAGKDPEVKKGMGVMVALLKHVGRAADRIGKTPSEPPLVRLAAYAGAGGEGPPAWVRHLAPRRARPVAAPISAAPPPPHSAPTHAPARAPGAAALPEGYGPDGFLTDPSRWTPELANALAAMIPLTLSDAHWQVINWARSDHAAAGASPNIRRISSGAGVAVRDLYALFPGKPGVLVAMLAGIPKPGGCL